MNKIFSFLCLIFFTCTLQLKSQEVIDEVVAIVGKNIVKLSDIENRYTQIRLQKGNEASFAHRCEILEEVLMNKLLLHKANVDSLTVSDEQVEAQVEEQLKMLVKYYGSKENIEKQAKRSYADIKEQYMDIVTDNMLIQQVEQGLTTHVKITPKEVSDFFNKIAADSVPEIEGEYEMAQIVKIPFISQEEKTSVKLDINKLRERILKGDSFSTLATLYSEDPGSAQKGGELGFFGRGDMVKEFEVMALSLKPGETSQVVETKYGYHIMQLIERRGDLINVRHILLIPKVSPEDIVKTTQFLDSVASAIRNKSITFDEAVEKFSDETTKKMLINPYTMNTRFTDDVAKQMLPNINITKMNVGDISAPSIYKDEQNNDVYRIVLLTSKIDVHKANLIDDYDKIHNMVLQNNKHSEVLKWADNIIKKTYISISDEFKDCSFQLNWTKQAK